MGNFDKFKHINLKQSVLEPSIYKWRLVENTSNIDLRVLIFVIDKKHP